jgi:hypothetical protein
MDHHRVAALQVKQIRQFFRSRHFPFPFRAFSVKKKAPFVIISYRRLFEKENFERNPGHLLVCQT